MAKKSAAKPAAAEELKAKKDIQKAVKLETKKKVRPRLALYTQPPHLPKPGLLNTAMPPRPSSGRVFLRR